MSTLEPDDLVLVAVLRDQRDLEIARVLGWYRIPLKTAPKMVRVDWIAFYLTSAFGDERWSVRYLAHVQGHELLTREDLLHDQGDHPSAQEPYFKILLGPLRTLSRPIPARRWRRVSFLYTTGERLLEANDVKDLTLKGTQARLLRAPDRKYQG